MEGNGTSTAIIVGVYATLALDIFSTFTSSPQTTELNAKARSTTLMKWVKIGIVAAVVGGVYGSMQSKRIAPIVATSAVAALMLGLYVHARNSGLESEEPATEEYGSSDL